MTKTILATAGVNHNGESNQSLETNKPRGGRLSRSLVKHHDMRQYLTTKRRGAGPTSHAATSRPPILMRNGIKRRDFDSIFCTFSDVIAARMG